MISNAFDLLKKGIWAVMGGVDCADRYLGFLFCVGYCVYILGHTWMHRWILTAAFSMCFDVSYDKLIL